MSHLIMQEERAATVQDVAELFIATLLTLAAQRGCSSPTLAPWRFFPALAAVCVREVYLDCATALIFIQPVYQ